MPSLVAINGEISDAASARISVLDRGFLYGDSVYETLRTYRGELWALDEHYQRLLDSARAIYLNIPFSKQLLADEMHALHRQANHGESTFRVVITRGVGEVDLDPGDHTPTRITIVRALKPPPLSSYRDGIHACTVGRQHLPMRTVPSGVKTGDYVPNLVARGLARKRGGVEAILVTHDGKVLEGTTSTVFVVNGGRLRTPPLSQGIVDGITRRHILQVAAGLGLQIEQVSFDRAALLAADEVFISSTTREIVPVTRVDNQPIGTGVPGATTRNLHDAFRRHVGVEPLDLSSEK